jgi:hypothetical protein
MVDSDRFAEFASENTPAARKPPRATEDSEDDLEIVRHDDRASGSAPPPDENDDLHIVRNMVDEFALGGADLAGARPFIAPPPPRKIEPKPEPEAVAEVEPEEPLFSVNWDEELSTNRRTTSAPPPVAAVPAKRAPRRPPAARPLEPIFVPTIVTAAAVIVGLAATVATTLSVEPFHTWYYLFAWYPFLLVVNLVTTAHARERSILGRRSVQLLPLLAWSVPVWLFFEAWNFRLQDWYYVGVPHGFWARRIGVCLSFATVLPGLFLLEEAARVRGAFEGLRSPGFDVAPSLVKRLWIAAGAVAVLLLALPSVFFPLLWGVPVLAIEPWLWRRGGPSLLRDLSEGRPGRVVRLLIAGLVCGLFWETANFLAGGKWIYTVPGLDGLKWFEMPPLGFLGFAPFALCCWSMARGLVELGLLADWEREREPATVPTGASAKDAIATVNAPPTPDAPPTSDESPVPLESPATEDASRRKPSFSRSL